MKMQLLDTALLFTIQGSYLAWKRASILHHPGIQDERMNECMNEWMDDYKVETNSQSELYF